MNKINHSTLNFILIGMSGAGKSTLGVLLAKALGKDFIDTDILIQQNQNKLLQQIIDKEGIEAFLNIEETIVSKLDTVNSVIATGGSVIYSDKIMHNLKKNGKIIYLYVPYDELEKRVTNITTRGIVLKNGNSLKDAYNERLPLYKKYSDIIVDCSKQSIENSIQLIIKSIQNL